MTGYVGLYSKLQTNFNEKTHNSYCSIAFKEGNEVERIKFWCQTV